MNSTDLFFSWVVDLKEHRLSAQNMEALYAMYQVCKFINQPAKYGPSLRCIMIDAIFKDYDSKFHKPWLSYSPAHRSISAGLKVDLDKILAADFCESMNIYRNLIFEVLDQVRDRVRNYDFEGLKADLQEAIRNETEVIR